MALAPMHRRTVNIVRDCCFLILEERCDEIQESPSLAEGKSLTLANAGMLADTSESKFISIGDSETWCGVDWKESGKSLRFVQLVFFKNHFEMDLPSPMLARHEARQIVDRRTGFYFLGERPLPSSFDSVIKTFYPLRKAYVHEDNLAAAEDVAYVLFDLWRFPIDTRFFLTTFGGNHRWELGKPLD